MSFPIGDSTLSQWETGARLRGAQTIDHLQALDNCYEAGGALVGLARAIGTPRGLPARGSWSHNFAAGGGPVWAWIRPDPTETSVTAHCIWGPIEMRLRQKCDPGGLIITSPGSMSNPALSIVFATQGWVDFGQGSVPQRLGVPVINGALHVRLLATQGRLASRFVDSIVGRTAKGGDWRERFKRFARGNEGLVNDALAPSQFRRPTYDFSDPGLAISAVPHAFAGYHYRQLREARHFSQRELALKVTGLLESAPVSEAQIRSLRIWGRAHAPTGSSLESTGYWAPTATPASKRCRLQLATHGSKYHSRTTGSVRYPLRLTLHRTPVWRLARSTWLGSPGSYEPVFDMVCRLAFGGAPLMLRLLQSGFPEGGQSRRTLVSTMARLTPICIGNRLTLEFWTQSKRSTSACFDATRTS